MSVITRRYKKSAIGAASVTLVPTTAAADPILPSHLVNSQIVVTTANPPPAEFWGTVTTDGIEYEITIERRT